MNNKKLNITPKGLEQLEMFKLQQVNVLLDKIVEAKEFPGSEEIEISGNEIVEFSKNFIYRDNLRMARKKILVNVAICFIYCGWLVSYNIGYIL